MTIQTPCPSVCTPWATAADLCEPYDDPALDPALVDDMLDVASDLLFFLSGQRFAGICRDTVRPAGRPLGAHGSHLGCGGVCGERVVAVTLGAYPIDSIIEVLLDGVALDPSEYKIVDNRWLVRTADADGNRRTWRTCQRLDLDSTEENTFEVTFVYGQMPPRAGVRAAAELGGELALACSPALEGKCKLPKRVTSLARQGVTETVVLDPMAFLDKGKTGLYSCDSFLAAVNPAGISRAAAVYMPGRPRTVRVTG